MKTETATTYRIKAEFNYYSGTFNAPADGYLMGYPKYDSYTGKETSAPLDFGSVEEAHEYLTLADDSYDAMYCTYDGLGQYSVSGSYGTHHGQYSRPTYTIVSAKSGRCTKAIIAECEKITA